MGLYFEHHWNRFAGVLLLIFAFVLIYTPWLTLERELFRQESIYAVCAQEYTPGSLLATAHGVPNYQGALFFPAATSLVSKLTGMTLENTMRVISCFMLVAGAVLTYFAAASQRTPRAGFVAAAFYLTPLIVLEKAVEGDPATANAFFLLAAQLVFFYYGIRRSNWNKAWIFSALLISIAFLSGGFIMLVFFIAPMFFFRRPLSVRSKFRTPGFAVAVTLAAAAATAWVIPYATNSGSDFYEILSDSLFFYRRKYWLDVLEFPLLLPLRLLPWSLIAWMPFCVALQDLDTTPIFSRYLRTLTFVTLAIVWVFQDSGSRAIFYLLGPLAVQTGITYELGTRRYGERLRKILVAGEIAAVGLAMAFVVVKFSPERWLTPFVSLSHSLAFRNEWYFSITVYCGTALLLVFAAVFRWFRKKQPLWVMLLLLSMTAGVFYSGVMAPYKAQVKEKKQLGRDLKKVISEAGGKKLYKVGINDLYGELYYTGIKVVKLRSIRDLPAGESEVFLVGTEFPGTTDRSWSNLLPAGYTYNDHPLSLWKGVAREKYEKETESR